MGSANRRKEIKTKPPLTGRFHPGTSARYDFPDVKIFELHFAFGQCRYRQRKRAELDSLEEQLHRLEGRNRELRDKAESVEREIQYVKDLLIEVYKARSQRLKQDTTP